MNIDKFNKRLESLRSERSSFISIYKDLSDFHLGHRGRFLTTDYNKGHKRNQKQINNKSKLAVRTLASGMLAGLSSPSRPWFKLGPPAIDPELREYAPVKAWLHRVETLLYALYAHSNLYTSLHSLYAELGVFGTAPLGVFKDFDTVIHTKPETVGSYMIAANSKGEIDTRYREYSKSVSEVIKEFGYENCSLSTQHQWDKGNIESRIDLVHAIEPNDNRDSMSPLARDKKFRSVYYEKNQYTHDKFLRRSGFDSFPIIVPRWDVTGEDIYGVNCPGIDALGITKGLQKAERLKYSALKKVSDPPLQGDIRLRAAVEKGDIQGSEIIWVNQAGGSIQTIYGNWRPDLKAIYDNIERTEKRIDQCFYVDLFLMISQSDRREISVREIIEKQSEKLLMLGPMLERLHSELFNKLIDRTFEISNDAGLLPPPPPELLGKNLKVEYVSVLAQAQRMVETTALEQVAEFTGRLVNVWPDARHKFDAQQAIDDYSTAIGTNPRVIRSDDEAEALAKQEQAVMEQATAMEQGQQLANVGKTVSEIDTGSDNALSNIIKQARVN